ncbi:ribosome recycling factor [Candidatus Wolfebacteria bacterium]|nr:ribosome recycling factor [Candidatus Wolfebacteria bacterium]
MLKDLELKKSELIVYFKNQLSGIRSGRPTAKLVENIQVDYSGQKLPVKQLGSISVLPPREIQIMVWDKSVASEIKKSVEAFLSVQANVENNLIRVKKRKTRE